MNLRKVLPLCAALAAGLLLLGVPRAAAEIRPSSDVLLPYFEVDLKNAPDPGRTTLFALCNDGEDPVNVKVSLVTNWGISVLDFDLTLAGEAVQTVNLRDWLISGRLPGGQTLPPEKIAVLQAVLTGKPSPDDHLYYATEVAPDLAVGAITFRSQGLLRPDVLWGDSFVVDPKLGYSEGETLVNLDPGTECLPECKRHGIRFLEDGAFDAGTELMIWTDRVGLPSPSPDPAGAHAIKLVAEVYDEAGHLFDQKQMKLMPVERMKISDLGLKEPFGWIELVTEANAFITGHYSASNLYSSALHAYCLPEKTRAPGGPGIRIEKLTNGAAADLPPGPAIPVGDPVTWTYVVTNTGDVLLSAIEVTDSDGVKVLCPSDSLDPGESMTCEASGTAEACQHANTAMVRSMPPKGGPVTDADTSHYFGEQKGSMSFEAFLNGGAYDVPPGLTVQPGEPLTWTYRIVNTGEFTLSGVTVSDQHGRIVTCPRTVIDPRETMSCSATGQAVAGTYAFMATVTVHPACGPEVTLQDPTHYFSPYPEPRIAIRKLVNGQDANVQPGPRVVKGIMMQWWYEVTNVGNTPLSPVTVMDDKGVTVSCPKTALQPGESMTCTGSGAAVTGQYCNIGTARGVASEGREVTASDPACYFGVWPAISLKKYTNGEDADTPTGPRLLVGSTVQWTYVVTNTGDVALFNVAVTDDKGVAVTCPKTALQPGEAMTCTASGKAVAGQYGNVGTATGKPAEDPAVTASDPSHYFGYSPAYQGCTPGYWKNHSDSWPPTGYSTGQTVVSVFGEASSYPALGTSTLIAALSFAGGPDLEGAAEILLRASVAALLNAAHPGVSYALPVGDVVASVNTALASGDRDTMLVLAAQLDAYNNQGCPLN